MDDTAFKKMVWKHFKESGRTLPWRETRDPYHILVSELMLQQTQVSRVQIKYVSFLTKFPTVKKLALAKQSDVLKEWMGLGYNRRALNLKKTCSIIMQDFKGVFPRDYSTLLGLPGIGQSTAGALLNFAFNIPTPFIETNIRSVYLHHYFNHRKDIGDKEILPIITRTLDPKKPKDWFYALYDYGTFLKKTLGKEKTVLHKKSKQYNVQKPFKGSNREMRSKVLQQFLKKKEHWFSVTSLEDSLKLNKSSFTKNILELEKEGFLEKDLRKNLWRLKP